MAAARPLRVGVIGAGANTRARHLPGLAAIDGVAVVAVCNRSEQSGRRVADEFGIARVATDPEQIFADDQIDAVCIGTWPYRHCEYTVRALAAGKHVLCEARMAMDAAQAREMVAAARVHPRLVAQLVPVPFDLRSWRTIRRLLREGALGELREIHVTAMNGQGLGDAPLHWRDRREYSGMNSMTLGMLVEIVHRWAGPTASVIADAETFVRQRVDPESGRAATIEIPDSLGVLARMAGGARATYRLSTVAGAPQPAGNHVSLYGSEATLHWSTGRDLLAVGVEAMTFARGDGQPRPLEPDAGTARGWEVEADFVRSIRSGAPVELTSFEDGLLYMRVVEAVWRSWSERRRVELAEV
ncbi:MAG: Gfo/Idh/MocA family oxidoreductase [Dehalococcoidia bacterium]|nr:Gfo/Idh/MocA family oxidoreductase [Dehalococcoidia bacterium]